MTDLKPCPFCGTSLIRNSYFSRRNADCYVHAQDLNGVDYGRCPAASVRVFSDKLVRIALWNARTEATEAQAQELQIARDLARGWKGKFDDQARRVKELEAGLKPFADLAAVRYPEEGGAPSWIDLMTQNGEHDEIELRSHVAAWSGSFTLDGDVFRRAAALLSTEAGK